MQAIHEALDQKLADDRRVMLTGEDIGVNGGVFRATEGCSTSTARNGSSIRRWLKPALLARLSGWR